MHSLTPPVFTERLLLLWVLGLQLQRQDHLCPPRFCSRGLHPPLAQRPVNKMLPDRGNRGGREGVGSRPSWSGREGFRVVSGSVSEDVIFKQVRRSEKGQQPADPKVHSRHKRSRVRSNSTRSRASGFGRPWPGRLGQRLGWRRGPSWPAPGSPSTNACPELNKVCCVHLSNADRERSSSSLKHKKKKYGHNNVLITGTLLT